MELVAAAIGLLILVSLGSQKVWTFFERPPRLQRPDTGSPLDWAGRDKTSWAPLDRIPDEDPRLACVRPRDAAWMLGGPTWRDAVLVKTGGARPWGPLKGDAHFGGPPEAGHRMRDARVDGSSPSQKGLW